MSFWLTAPHVRAQTPGPPPESNTTVPVAEASLTPPTVTPGPPLSPPSVAIIIDRTNTRPTEFGPIVTAYLSYLDAEQGVVDDGASRHEVTPAYYRHNTNRVRALRVMALRLARASQSDYLPEMVAVGRNELHLIFEEPPSPDTLKTDEIYGNAFRYLGTAKGGSDQFYIFARLDPYQQEELLHTIMNNKL